MSDYPELDLDHESAAALQLVIDGHVQTVVDVLADAKLNEPIAYLCSASRFSAHSLVEASGSGFAFGQFVT